MSESWIFGLGLALLLGLGTVIGRRLGPEYRTRLAPSIPTVAAVWVFYALHFGLVALAALHSTWHFSLAAPLALGGGLALVAAGAVMYLSATYVFGIKRQSGLDSTRLVTEGVYRWSRNPLFLGWALILLGFGLVRGSAMIFLLALFFWVSYRLYLPLEEELLGRLYGQTYEAYRRRSHRYFGPPRRGAETPPIKGMQPTASGGG